MPAAEVAIRSFDSRADYDACVRLQRETWGEDFVDVVPATILMVSQRVGGVSAGAFDADGRLIGFVFGISGIRDGRARALVGHARRAARGARRRARQAAQALPARPASRTRDPPHALDVRSARGAQRQPEPERPGGPAGGVRRQHVRRHAQRSPRGTRHGPVRRRVAARRSGTRQEKQSGAGQERNSNARYGSGACSSIRNGSTGSVGCRRTPASAWPRRPISTA